MTKQLSGGEADDNDPTTMRLSRVADDSENVPTTMKLSRIADDSAKRVGEADKYVNGVGILDVC